jgi:hypothetical protein
LYVQTLERRGGRTYEQDEINMAPTERERYNYAKYTDILVITWSIQWLFMQCLLPYWDSQIDMWVMVPTIYTRSCCPFLLWILHKIIVIPPTDLMGMYVYLLPQGCSVIVFPRVVHAISQIVEIITLKQDNAIYFWKWYTF